MYFHTNLEIICSSSVKNVAGSGKVCIILAVGEGSDGAGCAVAEDTADGGTVGDGSLVENVLNGESAVCPHSNNAAVESSRVDRAGEGEVLYSTLKVSKEGSGGGDGLAVTVEGTGESLTSGSTTKPQISRQYGTGTKTEI